MKRPLAMMLLGGVLASCQPPSGAHPPTPTARHIEGDDPDVVRPGYGNSELQTWFPLTPTEVAAMKNLDAAKKGDAHALLALAIIASGDKRDSASFLAYEKRVDAFIASFRPTLAKLDEAHQGDALNRAMHRSFFTGPKHGNLGSYVKDQNRVSTLLDTGVYNCVSSATLYVVLARELGLPVRGVILPTHAFVEYGSPGKLVNVETTAEDGFDTIEDAAFFAHQAAIWSAERGIRPATLEEYQARSIVEPHVLVVAALESEGTRLIDHAELSDDRRRLWELGSIIDPRNPELLENRLGNTSDDAHDLFDAKAFNTILKMHDVLSPVLDGLDAAWKKNDTVMQHLFWLRLYFARAYIAVGRIDEAIAIAHAHIDGVQPGWKYSKSLRDGFAEIFGSAMTVHLDKNEFAAGVAAVQKRIGLCVADEGFCRANLERLFGNWSIDEENKGDIASARSRLEQCIAMIPGDAECTTALRDFDTRHSN